MPKRHGEKSTGKKPMDRALCWSAIAFMPKFLASALSINNKVQGRDEEASRLMSRECRRKVLRSTGEAPSEAAN